MTEDEVKAIVAQAFATTTVVEARIWSLRHKGYFDRHVVKRPEPNTPDDPVDATHYLLGWNAEPPAVPAPAAVPAPPAVPEPPGAPPDTG